MRKGKLSFVLNGERLKGGFALVRMRKDSAKSARENWLLIKERDKYADPDLDPIEKWQKSVKSRRGMAGIARNGVSLRKTAKR